MIYNPKAPEQTPIPLETPEYSAGPMINRFMGKCIQVVYSADEQMMEQNALTHSDVLVLVKTLKDPIKFPTQSGQLFDNRHFDFRDGVPLRISSACLHGSLGDTDCLCHQETVAYMKNIREFGHGVFVYLPQDALGRGLRDKVRDHRLIHGVDEVGNEREPVSMESALDILHPAGYDIRRYEILGEVFRKLGLSGVNFSYMGDGERKRRQIVDEARLLIGNVLEDTNSVASSF